MLLGRPPSLPRFFFCFLFFPRALLPPLLIHSPDDSGVDFFQWASPLQNGQGEGCMPIKGPRPPQQPRIIAGGPTAVLSLPVTTIEAWISESTINLSLALEFARKISMLLWVTGRTTDGLILNGFCVNVGMTTESKSFVAHWFSPLLPVSICHVGWDCVIRRGWLVAFAQYQDGTSPFRHR